MSTSTTSTSTVAPELAALHAGSWTLDPTHTRVGFVARHMMVTKVRGSFGEFSADVHIADDPIDSSVVAEVQMASIDTGNAERDGHLRTNDFFDVESFPTMSLRSTGIEAVGGDYVLHADLTIKGVTKQVDFQLEFDGAGQDPWGNSRVGFTATTTIDRKQWGIEYNAALETGGVLIGDKVQIELDVQLVQS